MPVRESRTSLERDSRRLKTSHWLPFLTTSQGAKTLNALIVEDSPQVAQRIAEILESAGATVIGREVTEQGAISACERNQVEFAVIDLQLLQGTGYGVIRHLRRTRSTVATCIVVLTNHAVPALKVQAFEAGADYFLDKSKEFQDLARIAAGAARERGSDEPALMSSETAKGS
jgi:two-component system response regulator DevR